MDQVFKAYDVRGIVPDQLNADMCLAIGRAMARFAGAPEVLVARDAESLARLSQALGEKAPVSVPELGAEVDNLTGLALVAKRLLG